MRWRQWLKAASTRMELLAVITLSLAVVAVLTVQELDKQREATHFQNLGQRYALLLDEKIAQAEATIHQHTTTATLAANAQAVIEQQPWLVRLEQHNTAGDLLWSHVFIERGAQQPTTLPPALIMSMQEGAARLGRAHYSAVQLTQTGSGVAAHIHVAWPLTTTERFGFASWSIPKLLTQINTEAKTSIGVEATWAAEDVLKPSQAAHTQWVRFGTTGVLLPLVLTETTTSSVGSWQAYAVPLMTLLLLATLGLLYRETYLRQRAEAQTRENHERVQANARLATLGEIATMISHEVNQPLAAIETYAATCERVLAKNSASPNSLQHALQGIRLQADRAGRMIRSVQDFAQSRNESTQGVDVMQVIRELAPLIDIQAKRFKAVVKVQGPSGLRIETDKTMIEQVLLNLIRNGLEAMQDTAEDRRLLEVLVEQVDGWLEIAITDNGCGVPAEIRDRLFMPFVTSKAQGIGVGLSLCNSLVEKFRGRMAYADKASGGSVFTVRLPLTTELTNAGLT